MSLRQSVTYASRSLARAPLFSIAVVLTLGLLTTVGVANADPLGCSAQQQALDSVNAAIAQHNAQPHDFIVPDQQAAADAYNAEAAQLNARGDAAEANLNAHLFPGIEPIGVPQALAGTAWPFPSGDLAALGALLDAKRGQVAAVIMEPLRSELPPAGHLAGIHKLCREHGVVLIFDEVSSGFRIRVGGVQELAGVTPDMAVFAKAISNGYPMAAVVGRREVMEPAGRMFISRT